MPPLVEIPMCAARCGRGYCLSQSTGLWRHRLFRKGGGLVLTTGDDKELTEAMVDSDDVASALVDEVLDSHGAST